MGKRIWIKGPKGEKIGVVVSDSDSLGGVTANLYATKDWVESNYVLKSGDEMTGNLEITSVDASLRIGQKDNKFRIHANGGVFWISTPNAENEFTFKQGGNLLLSKINDGTPYTTANKPTSSDVGLGNVDNTSDLNKPISTATQTALDGKVPTTIKINGKQLNNNLTIYSTEVPISSSDSRTVEALLSDLYNNKVPTSRKVNGKNLSGDITLSASDIYADSYTVGAHISSLYSKVESCLPKSTSTLTLTMLNGAYLYTFPKKYNCDWLNDDPIVSSYKSSGKLNLNAIIKTSCIGDTIGGSTLNVPTGSDGWGTFWSFWNLQFFYSWNGTSSNSSAKLFIRTYWSSSWTTWKQLI